MYTRYNDNHHTNFVMFANAPDIPPDVPIATAPVIKLNQLDRENSSQSILLDLTDDSNGLELPSL